MDGTHFVCEYHSILVDNVGLLWPATLVFIVFLCTIANKEREAYSAASLRTHILVLRWCSGDAFLRDQSELGEERNVRSKDMDQMNATDMGAPKLSEPEGSPALKWRTLLQDNPTPTIGMLLLRWQ